MVECSVYGDDLGYLVDPESDTKEVFVPSPPSMIVVRINPRPGILLVSGGVVRPGWDQLEALKTYAEANKVAFVCPFSNDPQVVATSFKWLRKKCRLLNIKPRGFRIMALGDNLQQAQDVVDYLVDKCDADVDDAEEFSLQ